MGFNTAGQGTPDIQDSNSQSGAPTTMITMNMINGGNFVQINPIQMYNNNVQGIGMGQYQRMSGMSTGNVGMTQAIGSPEKRQGKKFNKNMKFNNM